MAVCLFIWRGYGEGGSGLNWVAAAAVIMLLLWNVYEIKTGKTTRFKPAFIASFLGLALITPHSLLSLPYIVLAWLEDQAQAAQEIGFARDEIVLNGIRTRKISWSELNNVVLKDGLLTIDFKNNKLFQQEVDDQEDDDYDGSEDEFNAFCHQQLLLHGIDPAK
jgi:hypothetical protein